MRKCLLALFILFPFINSAQTGATISGSFLSDGTFRSYTVYVPASYTGSSSVPLVVNLHGYTGSSSQQENYQDFRPIADTANFIVLHPEGTGPFTFLLGWGAMATVAESEADRVFLMSLLDSIEANYNINTNKIYSTGFSQGGFMTYDLACLHGDRFAAIASVAGLLSADHKSVCDPTHAIPVMHIHGTNDGLISYTGAGTEDTELLVENWVCYNNCNPTPAIDTLTDIDPADNSYPIHYVYGGGTDGATVEFYKIVNGGHQVPSELVTSDEYGVGDRNRDFTASTVIWEFFSKYSLDMFTSTHFHCSTYIEPTGIEDNLENTLVSIFPNPSNGSFEINIDNYQGASINISNVLGESVLSVNLSQQVSTFDLGNVAAGVYVVQVTDQDGNISKGKIIVQ